MSSDIRWEPYGYYRTKSNIAQFIETYDYESYADTVPETEAELERFWEAAVEDMGVVWDEEYDELFDTSDGYAFTDWFIGGRLNPIETLLDQWVDRTPDELAYTWEEETGERMELTFSELEAEVNRVANALRDEGIGRGDVVGIVFPLHPNAMIASLACLRIGAVQTQVFPGYGSDAIYQRFADCEADLVFIADGYYRGGDTYPLEGKLADVVDDLADLETVVTFDYLGTHEELDGVTDITWDSFVSDRSTEAETEILDADEPAFIAYSSGTTGKPKGTIHSQASMLVAGGSETKYHFDVSQGDTFCWITDFGWVAVPAYFLGAQSQGATVSLIGGSPFHPETERVWETIEKDEVTVFVSSPTGVRGLRGGPETPREDYDLSTLRILGSGGEPWDRESWNWYFEAVGGGHLPIVNISGGTELASGTVDSSPLTPLKPGTLYGPRPGVAANVYDEAGDPSDSGYLVIELPYPGMTHSLTAGDERYLDEYWRDYEDAWNQNDWVEIDDDGHWFIKGRADDTMNISGRRVTAPEIEEAMLGHPEIEEAVVIDVTDEMGNSVPHSFIRVTDEAPDSISDEAAERVSEDLGGMFRPRVVHVVDRVPRTQTEKIPRTRIKEAYVDDQVGDVSSLADGDALHDYPRYGDA